MKHIRKLYCFAIVMKLALPSHNIACRTEWLRHPPWRLARLIRIMAAHCQSAPVTLQLSYFLSDDCVSLAASELQWMMHDTCLESQQTVVESLDG
jgi:hypothetical protein